MLHGRGALFFTRSGTTLRNCLKTGEIIFDVLSLIHTTSIATSLPNFFPNKALFHFFFGWLVRFSRQMMLVIPRIRKGIRHESPQSELRVSEVLLEVHRKMMVSFIPLYFLHKSLPTQLQSRCLPPSP